MNEGFDIRYRATESRDARFDGRFYVGVTSTGIYCRPSCPAAANPKRENMRFFATAAAAQGSRFPRLQALPAGRGARLTGMGSAGGRNGSGYAADRERRRRPGGGVVSLYRRFRTKDELFQHLCVAALDGWIEAAEEALSRDDPWEGLAHYVVARVESRAGSLGPVAGTIAVTDEMAAKHERSDELTEALVASAHAAGVLRSDVTALDITALIVQLSQRDHVEQTEADLNSRRRIVAIALDGLRSAQKEPLPGRPPGEALFTEQWEQRSSTN